LAATAPEKNTPLGCPRNPGIQALRQGAKKGRKVIYIRDRAGIDFAQWHQWKNQHAIYFVSRVKENMKLEHPLALDFDRNDPINAGVIFDEMVSNSSCTMMRRAATASRKPEK